MDSPDPLIETIVGWVKYRTDRSGFGIAWFLGSAAMGLLYEAYLPVLIALSVGLQLASLPVFLLARRRT
jgi:hypothetical protein